MKTLEGAWDAPHGAEGVKGGRFRRSRDRIRAPSGHIQGFFTGSGLQRCLDAANHIL